MPDSTGTGKWSRVCSYCDHVMYDAGEGAQITHSICPACEFRVRAQLAIMRSVKAVRWTLCPVCGKSIKHPDFACWTDAGFVHLDCLTTKQREKAGLFQVPALPEAYCRCDRPGCGWHGKESDRYPVHPGDDPTQCPWCSSGTCPADENGDEL